MLHRLVSRCAEKFMLWPMKLLDLGIEILFFLSCLESTNS